MKYESFLESVREEVETVVKNNGVQGEVVIRDVLKNNNIHLKAISVVSERNSATPTIYLESYYEELNQGKHISDIAEEIFEMYQKNSGTLEIELDDFMDYSFVKERITYKVINYDMNKEMLKKIPYIQILDLAIVFNIVVFEEENNSATALIHKEHLGMWGITQKELEKAAFENAPKLMPATICKMEEIVADMIISDINEDISSGNLVMEECEYNHCSSEQLSDYVREEIEGMKYNDDIQMYVLTNKNRINGAAAMFYDEVLKEFADSVEKDLIIIPSSVHEVILIPNNNSITEDEVNEMIREVNQTELNPVEILSEHAYLYKRKEDEIYMHM